MRSWRDNRRIAQRTDRLLPAILTITTAAVAVAIGLLIRPLVAGRPVEAVAGADLQSGPRDWDLDGTSEPSAHDPSIASGGSGVKSQADGVEPMASNFRRAEDSLLVDVCFEFPDDGDWTIWSASLRYGKTIIQDFRSDPIVVREPERDGMQTVTDFGNGGKNSWAEPATKGDPGGRCDTLSFEMPPDTKPQELELSIDSIAAAPREGELCSQASLDRLQAAVDARAEGILIGCQDNGEQGEGFEVLSTPLEVSQAQAEELALGPDVFLDAFGVRGPWTYDVPPDL